jgi:molybdopterin-biosynthesis enzyme MoeA-like protein
MDLTQSKLKPNKKAIFSMAGVPAWLRSWWRKQSPNRQDRYASIAPLITVLLFLAAIIASFSYLRLEEIDREQETIKRDVEYAQQRLRLRLLERQEQLMRVARDVSSKEIDGRLHSASRIVDQQLPRTARHHLDRQQTEGQSSLRIVKRITQSTAWGG